MSRTDPPFGTIQIETITELALFFAEVGVYGVSSYAAACQRKHEIGIRIASGATRIDVLGLVIREGLKPTLLHLPIGAMGALARAQFRSGLLYWAQATDAFTLVNARARLIAVARLAAEAPAQRAAKMDLVVALRDN